MLDKKCYFVLQMISARTGDGYAVLDKQSVLAEIARKTGFDMHDFCSTLSFLKEQGYVDVKYQDKDSVCLCVTAKTRNLLDGLKETNGAQIVKNQFGLLLLCVGGCAFFGAFLATLFASLLT